MSLLISKVKDGRANDGKHFTYFRRKGIFSLIPRASEQYVESDRLSHVGHLSQANKLREREREIDQNSGENEDGKNGNEIKNEIMSLKNNYYASLDGYDEDTLVNMNSRTRTSVRTRASQKCHHLGDETDPELSLNSDSNLGSGSESDSETENETKSNTALNSGLDAKKGRIRRAERTQSKTKKNSKSWNERKREDFSNKKLLVPKMPVWHDSRCLRFSDWYSSYQQEIDDICKYTSRYFYYLSENGYDIKVNEQEMHTNLRKHLYRSSENVKKSYKMLK